MAAITVRTPVEGFTGSVAGVEFVDGVGSCTDRVALDYFRRHGYRFDTAADPQAAGGGAEGPPAAPAPEPAPQPPAKSANKPEWVAYAISQGADPDEAKAATKGDLVDIYGGDA